MPRTYPCRKFAQRVREVRTQARACGRRDGRRVGECLYEFLEAIRGEDDAVLVLGKQERKVELPQERLERSTGLADSRFQLGHEPDRELARDALDHLLDEVVRGPGAVVG